VHAGVDAAGLKLQVGVKRARRSPGMSGQARSNAASPCASASAHAARPWCPKLDRLDTGGIRAHARCDVREPCAAAARADRYTPGRSRHSSAAFMLASYASLLGRRSTQLPGKRLFGSSPTTSGLDAKTKPRY
jgi:hypothetical protein